MNTSFDHLIERCDKALNPSDPTSCAEPIDIDDARELLKAARFVQVMGPLLRYAHDVGLSLSAHQLVEDVKHVLSHMDYDENAKRPKHPSREYLAGKFMRDVIMNQPVP